MVTVGIGELPAGMVLRCAASNYGVLHMLHGLVMASIALITYLDDNHVLSSRRTRAVRAWRHIGLFPTCCLHI